MNVSGMPLRFALIVACLPSIAPSYWAAEVSRLAALPCRRFSASKMMAKQKGLRLQQAVQAVHNAAAVFGAEHERAAIQYTSAVLDGDTVEDLFLWEAPLFSGPQQRYDQLVMEMNRLQRLLAQRSAAEGQALMGLLRTVTGREADIEAAVADVRLQASRFGTRHARAAVEWTDRLLLSEGVTGNAFANVSNAALLEQRVLLFEECQLLLNGLGGMELGDGLLREQCEELRSALERLGTQREEFLIARARSAAPAGLEWSTGDAMPARLAEWGCDEELWARVSNKRALVRLANTPGGEARCRVRLAKLRELIVQEAAAERAARRAARRASRRGIEEDSESGAADVDQTRSRLSVSTPTAPSIAASPPRPCASPLLPPSMPPPMPLPSRARAPVAFKPGDWTCERCGFSPVFASRTTCFRCGAEKPKPSSEVEHRGPTHSEEYRQRIPAKLREWGCDEELWGRVKKKNALRRLAQLGDEEHGRRRIAALRANLLT